MLAGLKTVAMDMWPAYIRSTAAHVPDACTKIAFDKFYVATHLGDAVDPVRRAEHKALQAALGDSPLTKTRYLWLLHPWDCKFRGWARRGWHEWYSWAIRSRLEPIKKVARMVKWHFDGMLTAVVTGATNARAEGFNTMIQKLKRDARGFSSRDRFRAAIYFYLGDLDLYPNAVMK